MDWQFFFCIGCIVLVFAGLVANRPPDAVLVGAVVLVTLAGIISPEEAFAGFANTGMLTVAALYVVAAGLRETGALDSVGAWVLGRARGERSVLLRMAGSVTAMSAFLNNTPIVSMFIPIISDWCRKHHVSPSRLLIPLSYLCILGGTCTLIGTSTNLVVNGLLLETRETVGAGTELHEQLRPLGLFELGAVGLPYAVVGIVYLIIAAPRLLPVRQDLLETLRGHSRDYLADLRVEPGCRLIGQTVEAAGLRHLPGLFLIQITRGDQVISPVPPNQILQPNDLLTFTGIVSTIVDLERVPGLVPAADDAYETSDTERRGRMLCEAVVSPTCPAVGKTIRAADFRAAFNAAVVAVHRGGERLKGKLGNVTLRPGDTLLLQTGPHFIRANRNNPYFLLVSGIEDSRSVRYDKAIISIGLLVLLIVLMATRVVPVVVAAYLVAGLMVVAGCISFTDARRAIDWQTLVTIAAAFGLAKALVNSGCVQVVSDAFVAATGNLGPYAVLAGVYIMTSIFTETVTNNAAAALVFPFALTIGLDLGVDPRPLIMAVTFAASASFVTPLGYQTNLMVYGPGGYRLTDFMKIGLPLNLILLTCATFLIPRVWPFSM